MSAEQNAPCLPSLLALSPIRNKEKSKHKRKPEMKKESAVICMCFCTVYCLARQASLGCRLATTYFYLTGFAESFVILNIYPSLSNLYYIVSR